MGETMILSKFDLMYLNPELFKILVFLKNLGVFAPLMKKTS
jgi:hypothetical protein